MNEEPITQAELTRKVAELAERNRQKRAKRQPPPPRKRMKRGRVSRRAADDLQDNTPTETSDGEDGSIEHDSLVPDAEVRRELGGISAMTMHRRTKPTDPRYDPAFPVAISVNGRNFRSRRALERYKRLLIERAVRKQRERIALRQR